MQVHHAVAVLAHRQRTLHAELVFAGLDSVGVEPCLGLANSAHEGLERHLRCQFDERGLDDVDPARLGARADARSSIEVIADAASMPIFAASQAAATCGCRDGSRSPPKVWRCAVTVPTAISRAASRASAAGRRGDQSRRVVEPLRLRQPDVAELGPGSLRHPRRRPGRARASMSRRTRASASVTRMSPGSLICSTSTCASPVDTRPTPASSPPTPPAARRDPARAVRAVAGCVPCFDPAPTH